VADLLLKEKHSIKQKSPSILRKLERWINAIKDILSKLAKRFGAIGFNINVGLSIGISVSLSFSTSA